MPKNGYDEFGREIPDQTPVEVPLGYQKNVDPTSPDAIIRLVQTLVSRKADEQGFETLEESDDFDVPDDEPDIMSPYELTEMQEHHPMEIPAEERSVPQQGLNQDSPAKANNSLSGDNSEEEDSDAET